MRSIIDAEKFVRVKDVPSFLVWCENYSASEALERTTIGFSRWWRGFAAGVAVALIVLTLVAAAIRGCSVTPPDSPTAKLNLTLSQAELAIGAIDIVQRDQPMPLDATLEALRSLLPFAVRDAIVEAFGKPADVQSGLDALRSRIERESGYSAPHQRGFYLSPALDSVSDAQPDTVVLEETDGGSLLLPRGEPNGATETQPPQPPSPPATDDCTTGTCPPTIYQPTTRRVVRW